MKTDWDLLLRDISEKADAAIRSSNKQQRAFERIVAGLDQKIKNPKNRTQIGELLAYRVRFYADLGRHNAEIVNELKLIEAEFGILASEMRPILLSLTPSNRQPTLGDKIDLYQLEKRLQILTDRRDLSIALLHIPRDIAVIGMNEATKILVGEQSRYSVELREVVKDGIKKGAEAMVPGTALTLWVLQQFKDRVLQSADQLVNSATETDRLFNFGDYAKISFDMLTAWHRAAQTALGDLHKIKQTDFRNFVEDLRALASR